MRPCHLRNILFFKEVHGLQKLVLVKAGDGYVEAFAVAHEFVEVRQGDLPLVCAEGVKSFFEEAVRKPIGVLSRSDDRVCTVA